MHIPIRCSRKCLRKLRGNLPVRETQHAVIPSRVRQRRDVPAPYEGSVYHEDVERLPPVREPHLAAEVAQRREHLPPLR